VGGGGRQKKTKKPLTAEPMGEGSKNSIRRILTEKLGGKKGWGGAKINDWAVHTPGPLPYVGSNPKKRKGALDQKGAEWSNPESGGKGFGFVFEPRRRTGGGGGRLLKKSLGEGCPSYADEIDKRGVRGSKEERMATGETQEIMTYGGKVRTYSRKEPKKKSKKKPIWGSVMVKQKVGPFACGGRGKGSLALKTTTRKKRKIKAAKKKGFGKKGGRHNYGFNYGRSPRR